MDAPKFSEHFVEDVAFRAAWITLAQVPLVYLLATKCGPLNVLAGVSYERINHIHILTGRILFLSATVHMGIMMQSISVSDIFHSADKVMIIVRYGAGAYGTLTWIALSSILPVRTWSYRAFYINHWISTTIFLWVLFKHIPKYARSVLYISVGIILFDGCLYYYFVFFNNVRRQSVTREFPKLRKGPSREAFTIGHPVKMTAPASSSSFRTVESTIIIRMCDLPFSWKPGQHVRLYLPKLGSFEPHPFTPATCSQPSILSTLATENSDVENDHLLEHIDNFPSTNDMVLIIRVHSGLTRRLAEYHSKWLSHPCPNASHPSSSLTAFIDGPYGTPPAWERYENLILISTSTGVSFPLSIMDYLKQLCMENHSRQRIQRVRFIWTARHLEPHFDTTVTTMLVHHSTMLREAGISVTAEFYTTCPKSEIFESAPDLLQYDQFAHMRQHCRRYLSGRPLLRIWNPDKVSDVAVPEDEFEDGVEQYSESVEPEGSYIDERVSFESDGESTLIDEDDDDEVPVGSFWSQFATSIRESRQTTKAMPVKRDEDACTCAFVHSRRDKWSSASSASSFIERIYGSRPEIANILRSSTVNTEREKVMVAVCSNQDVVTRARNVVARLNLDFVAGRREAGVEIFTEGFS